MSLFGRKKASGGSAVASAAECMHKELAPRWDSVADMGKADRVTYFRCTSCGTNLTPEEAKARL